MTQLIFNKKSIHLRKNENHQKNYLKKIKLKNSKLNQEISRETCHL